jgi:hypothetical protein
MELLRILDAPVVTRALLALSLAVLMAVVLGVL